MNIKAMVFDHIISSKGHVDLQKLTNDILAAFPSSKWDDSHWNYYRSQITSPIGRYKDEFSEEIKSAKRHSTSS